MPAKSVIALTVAIAASLTTGAEGFGLFPVAVALTRLNRHCPDGTFYCQKLEPPTPPAPRVRGREEARGTTDSASSKCVETPAPSNDAGATPESSLASHPTGGEDVKRDGVVYLHLHDPTTGIVERRLFYVRSRGGQKSCKVTQKSRALAIAALKQDLKYGGR